MPTPAQQQQQQHRLNLGGSTGGAGGPPRVRKKSGYARPQFAGPMELETLMEEGAVVPGREGDAPTNAVDGGDDYDDDRCTVLAPLTNGDKAQPDVHRQQQQQQQQQRQQQQRQQQQKQQRKISTGTSKVAAMKPNSERPHSVVNLYLAACTGQWVFCFSLRNYHTKQRRELQLFSSNDVVCIIGQFSGFARATNAGDRNEIRAPCEEFPRNYQL